MTGAGFSGAEPVARTGNWLSLSLSFSVNLFAPVARTGNWKTNAPVAGIDNWNQKSGGV
jgi:hypothetical protein